jgi:hypothetical protein
MPLIQTLDSCTGVPGNRPWVADGTSDGTYAFAGLGGSGTEANKSSSSFLGRKKNNDKNTFPPATWGTADSGSFGADEPSQTHTRSKTWDQRDTSHFDTQFDSDYTPEARRMPHPELHSTGSYRSNRLDDPGNGSSNPFDPLPSSSSSNRLKRPVHIKSSSTPHAWAAASKYSSDSTPTYLPKSSAYDVDDEIDSLSAGRGSFSRPPPKSESTTPLPRDSVARAIALYDFAAVEVIIGFFDRVLD